MVFEIYVDLFYMKYIEFYSLEKILEKILKFC